MAVFFNSSAKCTTGAVEHISLSADRTSPVAEFVSLKAERFSPFADCVIPFAERVRWAAEQIRRLEGHVSRPDRRASSFDERVTCLEKSVRRSAETVVAFSGSDFATRILAKLNPNPPRPSGRGYPIHHAFADAATPIKS
jgi:hypothetical protein